MLETYTQTMNGLSLDVSNFQFCLPVHFLLLLIKQGEMPMLFHKSGVYISLKKYRTARTPVCNYHSHSAQSIHTKKRALKKLSNLFYPCLMSWKRLYLIRHYTLDDKCYITSASFAHFLQSPKKEHNSLRACIVITCHIFT